MSSDLTHGDRALAGADQYAEQIDTAAAGWYPEPLGTKDQERFWNGSAWTESVRPMGNQTHHAPAGKVDNSFAWALAFTPIALIVVEILVAQSGAASASQLIVAVVAIALNSILAWADAQRVKAVVPNAPSFWLGTFLVPVYLFSRASKLKQSYAIPVVWIATFLVSLLGSNLTASTVGVSMDMPKIESSISQWATEQIGGTVSVDCPSSASPKPGSGFQCVMTASDDSSAMVDVTVQNSAGDIVWEVRQ